ncbi:hypothetical protein ACKC9G_18080 [Pokkaliibacter sp. CJK22405]|uniref:hypothetical protein n=1 Tax=Pokkaliibacter sp. CJK22405 TaxID=3384615 RepID=UPI003984834F
MTATHIAIFLILGVMALVAMALIGQSFENARNKKRQRTLAIKEQVRHIRDNLQQMPDGFLPVPLHIALLQLLISRLNELRSLDPKDPTPSVALGECRAELETKKGQSDDSLQPILYSEKQAVVVKRQLKHSSDLVKALYEQRLFSHQQAQHFVQHLKLTARLVSLDISWLSAQRADQRGNWKSAKAMLGQCLQGYEQVAKYRNVDDRVLTIRKRISELQRKLDMELEKQKHELEDELKRITDEENKWRIKQDYED